MKFGKSVDEAATESRGGTGGGFIKAMKDGDTTLHIIDEYDSWLGYWEHFNPDGYSFPCPADSPADKHLCPGCSSDNEKMKKASRKYVFNAWDGEYTNVWKVSKTVHDKLKNRYERIGTITDRPYIITRIKDGQRYDYDLEGQEKASLPDEVREHTRDLEEMLAQAYEQEWGSSSKVDAKPKETKESSRPAIQKSEPEAKKESVTEESLRAMSPDELRKLCVDEQFGDVPASKKTTDAIVDWMLEQ